MTNGTVVSLILLAATPFIFYYGCKFINKHVDVYFDRFKDS